MIKNKGLLIVIFICFIGINTCYFWSGFVGPLFLLLTLACFLTLVIAALLLLRQLYFLVRERFTDKPRIYSVLGLLVLLALIITRPFGIIDFEKLQGKSIFYASHEGSANCTSTLKLMADHRYYAKDVCFGVQHRTGTYSIVNDTIKFKPNSPQYVNDYFAFGIVKKNQFKVYPKVSHLLHLYQSKKDTGTYAIMAITQNDLMKW